MTSNAVYLPFNNFETVWVSFFQIKSKWIAREPATTVPKADVVERGEVLLTKNMLGSRSLRERFAQDMQSTK